jgi:23S rRNA (pseudouridine1915-N3)-methyltransferase
VRLTILAVGRLSRTTEGASAQAYVERATATGRALGLGPVDILEVEGRKPGRESEGEALLAALPSPSRLIACDEGGRAWPSVAFAERIGALRDAGERRLVFVIGGADGLSAPVRQAASETIAFGPQTWPHALVRVLLAEQLYRAAAILAGTPYHRA